MSIEQRARVLVFANQKGGVGKSTSCSSIGHALFNMGKKVLFIDMDAQQNLSYFIRGEMIARSNKEQLSVLEVLEGKCSAKEAIYHTEIGDIIPSKSQLSGWTGEIPEVITEKDLSSYKDTALLKLLIEQNVAKAINSSPENIHKLDNALQKAGIYQEYDYILLDCAPSLGLSTLNCLNCSNSYVVIPLYCDATSRQALEEILNTISSIQYFRPNSELHIGGFLLTNFRKNLIISRALKGQYEEIAATVKTVILGEISSCVSVQEATAFGKDLLSYDRYCTAALDYQKAASKLIEHIDNSFSEKG